MKKNFFISLMLLVMLVTTGCSNHEKKLLEKVEPEIEAIQTSAQELFEMGSTLTSSLTLSDTVTSDPTSQKYKTISENNGQHIASIDSILEKYDLLIEKVEQHIVLYTEYSGKDETVLERATTVDEFLKSLTDGKESFENLKTSIEDFEKEVLTLIDKLNEMEQHFTKAVSVENDIHYFTSNADVDTANWLQDEANKQITVVYTKYLSLSSSNLIAMAKISISENLLELYTSSFEESDRK